MKTVATIITCVTILGGGAGTIWALDHFKIEPKKTKSKAKPRPVRSAVVMTIDKRIDVRRAVTTQEKAREMGAIGLFSDKYEGDVRLEPVESLTVDVPNDLAGKVLEVVGSRGGEMQDMSTDGATTRVVFKIPARGLIGLRSRHLRRLAQQVARRQGSSTRRHVPRRRSATRPRQCRNGRRARAHTVQRELLRPWFLGRGHHPRQSRQGSQRPPRPRHRRSHGRLGEAA